jgi:hypothetical protein
MNIDNHIYNAVRKIKQCPRDLTDVEKRELLDSKLETDISQDFEYRNSIDEQTVNNFEQID